MVGVELVATQRESPVARRDGTRVSAIGRNKQVFSANQSRPDSRAATSVKRYNYRGAFTGGRQLKGT